MTDRPLVVVVSADVATRNHVRLTLGDERFEVRDAADTSAAIDLVAERSPQVVVLDLELPGGGAAALARSLRAQPETAGIRSLALAPRSAAVQQIGPGGADLEGFDVRLFVPSTAFSLLREIDELARR